MEDEFPDMPLDNFGPTTEVAEQPSAPETPVPAVVEEQTTQPEPDATGSEVPQAGQPAPTEDNSIADVQDESGRPEKRDRLQARFGELTSRNRQQEAMIEQLNAQLAQNQALAGIQQPQPDENGEIDIQKLMDYNRQVAQASANASATQQVRNLEARLERESIANRMDSEGSKVEEKYKTYLDADPTLAADIQAEVEERVALARGDLNVLKAISPMKIAERYMRGIEAAGRRAQSVTAQNLSDVQAEGVIVPDSAPTALDPNSEEALEARVANLKF